MKFCLTNSNVHIVFPATERYNYTSYYRNILPPFMIVFHFLYGKLGSTNEYSVIGYGLLVTDVRNEVQHSIFFVGEGAVDLFLNELFVNAQHELNKMVDIQLALVTSKEERDLAKSIRACGMCNRDINENNRITIDHNHHILEKNKLICSYCNKLKYPKRLAYIWCHGLSFYVVS